MRLACELLIVISEYASLQLLMKTYDLNGVKYNASMSYSGQLDSLIFALVSYVQLHPLDFA
jgi:hypothetical protein